MNIKKYLVVGAIIQAVIIVERIIRGVSADMTMLWDKDESLAYNLCTVGIFLVALPIGMALNIIIWPISIVCEGYLIYKGE